VEAPEVLQIVLLVVAILLCGMAGWALWVAVGLMRSLKAGFEEIRSRLVPMLDKADITLDAINAELLRIDAVVSRFESVSDKVVSTTHAVQEAVNAPMEALSSFGGGVLGTIMKWRRWRKGR